MSLETGQRVGDYEVINLLGTGGMGRVYSVRNIISDRIEAMKVLLPDFASEPDLAARFMAEIRTLAGLEHPNIAQLRTAFQFQNQLVMIMEFVEGTTLEKLASQTRIPLDHVLDFSTQVLAALSYAHSCGVTHRDIKPANIMITSHGVVKLMDFGIAKSTNDLQLTSPGTTMGSAYYMSPEQVRGGTVDARSDIYSFGVTLYEMLTGRRPFQADTSFSILNAQLNEAPTPPVQVNPQLSPDLNDIVLRAMVKLPEGRFQTAEAFRAALRSLREPQPQQQQPAQPQQQRPAPVVLPAVTMQTANKGHRGLWLSLGAVAAIVALIAVATLLPRVFTTHAGQKSTTSTSSGTDSKQTVPPSKDGHGDAPNNPPQGNPSDQSSNPLTDPLSTGTPETKPTQSNQPEQPVQHSSGGFSQTPQIVSKPKQASGVGTKPNVSNATTVSSSSREINMARHRMIDLSARADAAKAGVQQIRNQQAAQGLDIRGDILASMGRMNSYLDEADRALNQDDLQAADQYMDRAEKEISTLQTFLGR